MLDPKLARQALARPLSDAEKALASALEAIFASGTHDFADVAQALQARGTERPSGDTGAWSEAALVKELTAINAALDAAYAATGIGA